MLQPESAKLPIQCPTGALGYTYLYITDGRNCTGIRVPPRTYLAPTFIYICESLVRENIASLRELRNPSPHFLKRGASCLLIISKLRASHLYSARRSFCGVSCCGVDLHFMQGARGPGEIRVAASPRSPFVPMRMADSAHASTAAVGVR